MEALKLTLLGCSCSQKIDRAVSGQQSNQPEEEEIPKKRLSRATSKHQAIKTQLQEKYAAKNAPGVELASR